MNETERRLDYRDPEWLADQLGVDKSTIYRYLQDGALPGLQLGRKWLVSERQVVEFLDREARKQTDERRRGALGQGGDRSGKYTERSRQVLVNAQEQARAFRHNYIGTEHLLLGLLQVTDGLAHFALHNLGVEPELVRSSVLMMVGEGNAPPGNSDMGLTPRAKHVIERSVEEAQRLNHSYIGTEHLLVGLIEEQEGIAGGLLKSMGVTVEAARREIARLLQAGPEPADWQRAGKPEDANGDEMIVLPPDA